MRAIVAILPLAGLLCWLNPSPVTLPGDLRMGLSESHQPDQGDKGLMAPIERRGLGTAEAVLDKLDRGAVTRPATAHSALSGNTLLLDTAIVR